MRFVADESCDFTVVRNLRASGYDVVSVTEAVPGAADLEVLRMATEEQRILITEDKDFGDWVFAHGEKIEGVVLLRFSARARRTLAERIGALVRECGPELRHSFTVFEPGRARIRKMR